ncbi:MAG: archease [Deltaproteobacteria bacterium]|nr:archease [Deltaproteobacteria bacterium]
MRRYRLIDHTADLAVYFYGATPREVFANAGPALFSIVLNHPPHGGVDQKRIEVAGRDPADLLNRFLSELLYLFQSQGLIVTEAIIADLSDTALTANLIVVPFDLDIHGLKTDIKAVTYHQLEFGPRPRGWRAKVVFDL